MPLFHNILKNAGKLVFILTVSYLDATLLLTERHWFAVSSCRCCFVM